MTQPAHITHFYSHDLEIRAVSNQNYTATIELFNRIQLRDPQLSLGLECQTITWPTTASDTATLGKITAITDHIIGVARRRERFGFLKEPTSPLCY
ncbi:unnamed protein product [Lepidochelys kempii]